MKRELFSPENELFRDNVSRFLQSEVIPNIECCEARGDFEHDIY